MWSGERAEEAQAVNSWACVCGSMSCLLHLTRHFSHLFFLLINPRTQAPAAWEEGEDPLWGGGVSGEGHGTHIWGSEEGGGGNPIQEQRPSGRRRPDHSSTDSGSEQAQRGPGGEREAEVGWRTGSLRLTPLSSSSCFLLPASRFPLPKESLAVVGCPRGPGPQPLWSSLSHLHHCHPGLTPGPAAIPDFASITESHPN